MSLIRFYSLQEVQRLLKLNNRQLWKWLSVLSIEPVANTQDTRRREITSEQFEQIQAAMIKVVGGPVPDVNDMAQRIEELENLVGQLREEVKGLKSHTRSGGAVSVAGPSKKELSRLAVRHGGKMRTSEGWDWPSESRVSLKASLVYIQSRLQARGVDLQECDDAQCECHQLVLNRSN
jgi:vacuolar-type H+-ATPase subunit I/STV1